MGNNNDKTNSKVSRQNVFATVEGLQEFAALLVQQEKIRLFVDGPPGMGHQASSVLVLRALVAPIGPPSQGLGYGGKVEVIYWIRPNGEDTLKKLYLLLPELENKPKGRLENAEINLVQLTDNPPADLVLFGFTGGADDTKDVPDPNFITKLNLKYFLRLQPYKWGDPPVLQIQREGQETIDLNKEKFLGTDFGDLAYFQLAEPVEDKIWRWIEESSTEEIRTRCQILKWLIGASVKEDFDLQFVYGVRSFACPMSPESPEEIIVILIANALHWQLQDDGKIRKGAKSSVIVNLDTFAFADKVTIGYLTDVLKGEYTIGEKTVGAPSWGSSNRSVRAKLNRAAYFDFLRASERSRILDGGTLEEIQNACRTFIFGRADHVIFLQLGAVPPAIFSSFYVQSTLPRVFEGMGTANLALNNGQWYFHVNRPDELGKLLYPTVTLGRNSDNPQAKKFKKAANQINRSLSYGGGSRGWTYAEYTPGEENAPTNMRDFMVQFDGGQDGLREYLLQIRDFYSDPSHCKLRRSLGFLNSVVTEKKTLRADAKAMSLEQIYAELQTEIAQSGKAALSPGLLDQLGAIGEFYKELLSGSGANLIVDNAVATKSGIGVDVTSVRLTGSTTAPMGPTDGPAVSAVLAEFTQTEGRIQLSAGFTQRIEYSLAGAPWIPVKDPFIELLSADGILPVVGRSGATLPRANLRLSYSVPATDGQWLFQGDFLAPPSLSSVFELAGGVNLLQALPDPFRGVASLSITSISMLFNAKARTLDFVTVNAATTESIPLLPGLFLKSVAFTMTVTSPIDMKSRAATVAISGNFKIGARSDAGVIQVAGSAPDLALQGQLISGVVKIEDLLSLFWPNVDIQLPSVPQIDAFFFNYVANGRVYTVSCNLNIDWTVADALTIKSVGLLISNSPSLRGFLNGSIIILPKDPDAAITLFLVASYLGAGLGWRFEGRQTGGRLPLGKLIKEYLHWDTDKSYDIAGLGFSYETNSKSWEFTAKTAEPWQVPFIPELSVTASFRAGYNGKVTPILIASSSGRELEWALQWPQAAVGSYARLETEWKWRDSIDITVWFDYSPQEKAFGFTWKSLSAKVNKNQTNEWIGTLSFKDNVTLGSMIEDMVSWITGSKFGLEAPWSFLDSIPLSGLSLIYNFTKETVAFGIDIGPIELGFARIDSIKVSYGPNPKDAKKNAVLVSLAGSFPWNVGEGANGNAANLGPWDASQPGTAPAPPGNGNKYLDLRLLALGQHVHLTGLEASRTVQEAIDLMKNLPEPEPGKIPPVTFGAQSAWLIGADFGLLRLEDGAKSADETSGKGVAVIKRRKSSSSKKRPTDLTAPNAAPPSGYLITLQIVFNDPSFYALRIALDGEPAKIFKGLDFQILYRQVSDTVGVYQTEITLPDVMRHLSVGAYSVTLPIFGISIFTNGDFQVDIGFPWNSDFARSFSIEGIIYPGIPVLGSAGFYFGKLSSASTRKVPQTTLGTFNPVIVFGFGLQVGFGKSIEYGVLKAGFSLTVIGILEGVLAKWNPYLPTSAGGGDSQIQGAYYFWLQGTVGIIGKLYGSVDFAIIKASVNVELKLLVQLTYESYVSISVTVIASVDVSASLEINAGIFTITIHFSFSMRLKETFTMLNSGQAPWLVGTGVKSVLQASANHRSRAVRRAEIRLPLAAKAIELNWSNLQKPAGGPIQLSGYMALALTVARDEWSSHADPSMQTPCYVASIFIDSMAPTNQDVHKSAMKASGRAADTSFENLCKTVLRWSIAALQSSPLSAEQVDQMVIAAGELELLNEALISTDSSLTPIQKSSIDSFLAEQFLFSVQSPPEDMKGNVNAAYFPMAPSLNLSIPSYGSDYAGSNYRFEAYNSIDEDGLSKLRHYFDELAVKVRDEMGNRPHSAGAAGPGASFSMADWIYTDYFLLLARQMVQAARESLRDFKYPIAKSQTSNDIVDWINATGQIAGVNAYTLHDLFAANQTHSLSGGSKVTIGVTYAIDSESFDIIATKILDGRFASIELAQANALKTNILRPGAIINYPGKSPCIVQPGDSLDAIAKTLGVQLADLLNNTHVLTQSDLLSPNIMLAQPYGESVQANWETFTIIAEKLYGNAFYPNELALANAANDQILQPGAIISFPDKSNYTVKAGDTLISVAKAFDCALADLVINAGLLTQAALLMPGSMIFIPLVRTQSQASDSFRSISDRPVYAGAFDAAALVSFNAGLGVLQTGAKVEYPQTRGGSSPYFVQPRDCLGDIANYFGVSLAELLRPDNGVLAQTDLIAPLSVLFTPPFACQAEVADQLQTIASRYATTVDVIAQEPTNGEIADLFATIDAKRQPAPYLDIPHLTQFRVGELIAECQRSFAIQNLSSMTSRYYLHGLRLPTQHIVPLQAGMWVRDSGGRLSLPAYAGLYALTGQQFPIPTIKSQDFVVEFDNSGGPAWLQFKDRENKTIHQLQFRIAPDSDDAKRIGALIDYAQKNRLDIQVKSLGVGKIAESAFVSYPFTSSLVWQSASSVTLPYAPSRNEAPSLRLWRMPDAMLSLFVDSKASRRAVNPRFKLQIARYDEATGSTQKAEATNYGWATVIDLTIKKIVSVSASPATACTYEIVGAGGNDILLLERILTQIGADESQLSMILLGYAPEQTGNAPSGVQTDSPVGVTMGIAQVNLSTDTRPSFGLAARLAKSGGGSNLLNSPSEFITLLWEASITRSGGFYLYYYSDADGRGLPDRIFNDKNEATLTLIILYAKPALSSEQNTAASYMNVVATGGKLDAANSVLFAEADPSVEMNIVPDANASSLAAIAYAYYSDVGDLAQWNSGLPLAAGVRIEVDQGLFQAPLEGASLVAVAQKFGTKATPLTVADLQLANKRAPLQDPLMFPTAINLPPITVTVGADPQGGTLGQIADFYGEDLTALAAKNQDVVGIFAASKGQPVRIPGGPRTRHASVPTDVISVEAVRPVPPPAPKTFDDPNYGKNSLLNLYTLLNYRIADNVYFRASGLGLPSGPTTQPSDLENSDKIRCARTLSDGDDWRYKQSFPYPTFAKTESAVIIGLPDPAWNPYLALGYLLQVDYQWQDNYGNVLVTTLSSPQRGDKCPLNQTPTLTGYTDAIVNINQWPAISTSWRIVPIATEPQLELQFTFDNGKYQGMLEASPKSSAQIFAKFTEPVDLVSASDVSNYKLDNGAAIILATPASDGLSVTLTTAQLDENRYTLTIKDIKRAGEQTSFSGDASFDFPDNPNSRSSSVQGKALQDLHVYTQLFYQLTDPNGIACSIDSTLFQAEKNPEGVLPLSQAQLTALQNWLFYGDGDAGSIYAFLKERSEFKTGASTPRREHDIVCRINSDQINPTQIFNLSLAFTIKRLAGLVYGTLQTTGGIRESSVSVAPRSEKIDSDSRTVGIAKFAKDFQDALSIDKGYRLKIATGIDRNSAGGTRDTSTIWAVRVGWPGHAIGYQITAETKNNPHIFAPRPVLNHLRSETVKIRDYSRGKGISPTSTRAIDFVDIDVDIWVQQFFGAIDGLLAPQFTAPMQIVGEKKREDYLGKILKQKKALAGIAKRLMIPAFADETSDPSPAQEAFYQQMLSRLANAYETRAALQFAADVKADIKHAPGYPPQLFGNIVLNKITTLSPEGEPNDGEGSDSGPSFTSPKVALQTNSSQPLVALLTAPDMIKSGTGAAVPSIRLDLSYNGTSIEHQIGRVPGLQDYSASTWLDFVIRDEEWPLKQNLGEFPVPMFLRAFPASPSVSEQSGVATYPNAKNLSKMTRWNYAFTYTLPFHYPHDIVYCEVEFDIQDLAAGSEDQLDAFPQLAQFITVYPEVNNDLQNILAKIDASRQDDVEDAAVALNSFCDMVGWVIDAAGDSESRGPGLAMRAPHKRFASLDAGLNYNFHIEEGFVQIGPERALRVSLVGTPPPGVGNPIVLVDPDRYDCEPYREPDSDCDQPDHFCFVYKNKATGRYLTDTEGQTAPDRHVVLQDMDILQRQDAWSTIFIKRNEKLVAGRLSAEPFIYQTPKVQFANALHPVIDSAVPISLAEIGSAGANRSLLESLQALFQALFANTKTRTALIQVEVTYEYSINRGIQSVSLPVMMQAPLEINLAASMDGVALQEMIEYWAQAIELWFETYLPDGFEGTLWFDVAIMSNLTVKPMPLLRLRKLYLPVDAVRPPLSTEPSLVPVEA